MNDTDYKEKITTAPHHDPFTGVKDGVVFTLWTNGGFDGEFIRARQWFEPYGQDIREDIVDARGNYIGVNFYNPRREV